jgi:hypothetical protein
VQRDRADQSDGGVVQLTDGCGAGVLPVLRDQMGMDVLLCQSAVRGCIRDYRIGEFRWSMGGKGRPGELGMSRVVPALPAHPCLLSFSRPRTAAPG